MTVRFRVAAVASGGLAVAHVAWSLTGLGGTQVTQLALRTTLFAAAVATTATCLAVARRSVGAPRRGWMLFGLTGACWALSQAMAGFRELTTGHRPAFPSPADVPANVAIVLSVLALVAFLRGPLSSAARRLTLLDGLLIAASLLSVSWAAVLEGLYHAADDGPARVLGAAYPMGDVVLASLVLVVAGRANAGSRLPWALLGTGLGLFAVGHSSFASSSPGSTSPRGPSRPAGWRVASWWAWPP